MTRLRRNRARSPRHRKPARPIAMNAGGLSRVTVPSRRRNRKRRKSRRKPPRRNLSPSRLNWLRLRAFWTSIAKLYEARGIPPADAVRALFNAQRALQERPYGPSSSLPETSALTWPVRPPAGPQTNDQVPSRPLLRGEQLERAHTTQQQQAGRNRRRFSRQSPQFAADPKHVHFPAVQKMMAR